MTVAAFTYEPIMRGDSARIALQFVQQDLISGEISLIDLTGASVELSLRDGTRDLGGTTASGLGVDAALSIASRSLLPTETKVISADALVGRWRITYPNGRVETVLSFVVPVQD